MFGVEVCYRKPKNRRSHERRSVVGTPIGPGFGAMWGEEKAKEMLEEAGFTKVEIERLPHDFQNYYYIATKG
jgi:Zn-dependent membrane protease YugP